MGLNGKVAIITGGGSGIGRACALQIAKDGAAVAVWDLNGEGAAETARRITQAGGKAIAITGDAADPAAIAASLQTTREKLGLAGILLNNAGISKFAWFKDTSVELLDHMLHVNLRGPFLVTQAVLPDMLAAGWGRIVSISSCSAQSGDLGLSHYAATKGGIMGFTRALALELAGTGVTVNHIAPGMIDTPMLRSFDIDVEELAAASAMKRAGTPDDIAGAFSYLASEQAGYFTGQGLSVNGGRYML